MAKKYSALRAGIRVDGTKYIFVENWHTPKCFPYNVNQIIEYIINRNDIQFEFQKRGSFKIIKLVVRRDGNMKNIEKELQPMAKYLLGFIQSIDEI